MNMRREVSAILLLATVLADVARGTVMHAGRIAGVLARGEATQQRVLSLALGGGQSS